MHVVKQFNIRVSVSIFREGKRCVAYSPALDLSTSGKTLQETRRRFAEAVEILFEELDDLGTMDEVLAGLGWERSKRSWKPPLPVSHDIENFRVPLPV